MPDDEVRITLRLPADLHALLVQLAQSQRRSLNGQVVYLLLLATRSDKP